MGVSACWRTPAHHHTNVWIAGAALWKALHKTELSTVVFSCRTTDRPVEAVSSLSIAQPLSSGRRLSADPHADVMLRSLAGTDLSAQHALMTFLYRKTLVQQENVISNRRRLSSLRRLATDVSRVVLTTGPT